MLRDTVRGRWGFDSVIVSDFDAVPEFIPRGIARIWRKLPRSRDRASTLTC